jgi:hypothetical protein
MRILSSSQPAPTQNKKSANRSRKSGKEIVGKTTGGQNIVKKQRPRAAMSESEIRAKLAEHKNPKKEEVVKKPAFDTSMKDDIAEKMDRKSPIKKGAELELARKKSAVKTKVEVVKKPEVAVETKVEGAEVANAKSAEETQEPKKLVNAQGEEIKSDVGKNNPNDPATTEKLKELLKTNAFSFSQKEKDALANILNK